ncbi:MAG: hypothetical protein LBQ69_03980 [Treponema sp.]|jgi:hypothetical protein|nr:hypothetical protein [Treponema sp.]
MKNRLINICAFITMLAIFVSCSVIKKNVVTNNRQSNITDFFFVEIMDGNTGLSFHREKYEVIDMFGEPLDINVTEVSFNLAGGMIIEKHGLIYDDFIHIYYVFEDGTIFYEGFIIEKRLERLKTITIGDTSDKLLLTFPDKYYIWDKKYQFLYRPRDMCNTVCNTRYGNKKDFCEFFIVIMLTMSLL